jgi:hypothetical protein
MFEAVTDSENIGDPAQGGSSEAGELTGAHWLLRTPATPEEELLAKEQFEDEKWAADVLDRAAGEDAEASAIIRAMRNGCDPRSDIEIAEETALPIEEVRKAKKRLNRLIDRIASQVHGSTVVRPVPRRATNHE